MAQANPDHELIEILLRGSETKDLDYKAPAEWNERDKKACCQVVKDILAMANTRGGFLVFGVSERETGFSFDGLTEDQAKTFDTTRVNRFLQSYADPPINTTLRKIECDNKVFVLIEVPAFPDTPHICQKDFPDVLSAPTLYVRTDNNESAPISQAADFRSLVERAVRNRGDALLAAFHSILKSGSVPPEPSAVEAFLSQHRLAAIRFEHLSEARPPQPLLGFVETSFSPERFDASRFTIDRLRNSAERAQVNYTGWPFLFINPNQPDRTYTIEDGLETYVDTADFANNALIDFWRFQQSGFFYHRTALRPSASEPPSDGSPIADVRYIAIQVGQAIDCLTRLYDGLFEDSEYLAVLLRLVNTENRALVLSSGLWPPWNSFLCRIPEISVQRRLPLAEWRAAVVDNALSLVREIYLRFNWPQPDLGLARTAIEKTFSRQL